MISWDEIIQLIRDMIPSLRHNQVEYWGEWAWLEEAFARLYVDVSCVERHPVWPQLLDELEKLELEREPSEWNCLIDHDPRVPRSVIMRKVRTHPLLGELHSRSLRNFLESSDFFIICQRFEYTPQEGLAHFGLERIAYWFVLWFMERYDQWGFGIFLLGGVVNIYAGLAYIPYRQIVTSLPRSVLYDIRDLDRAGTRGPWINSLVQDLRIHRARHLPFLYTEQMVHWFKQAPDGPDFDEALLYGQVRGLGGSDALFKTLRAFYGTNLKDTVFREDVIRFLVRHEASLDYQILQPLLNYLEHRHKEDRRFRVEGRSLATLQQQMKVWYAERQDD